MLDLLREGAQTVGEWLATGWGVLVGTFLGAFLGYRLSLRGAVAESRARRDALVSALVNQLDMLPQALGDGQYVLGKTNDINSLISTSAHGILLGAGVLDARRDRFLIPALVLLDAAISHYNGFVGPLNQAFFNHAIEADGRARWHRQVCEHYASVVDARDSLRRALAIDEMGAPYAVGFVPDGESWRPEALGLVRNRPLAELQFRSAANRERERGRVGTVVLVSKRAGRSIRTETVLPPHR